MTLTPLSNRSNRLFRFATLLVLSVDAAYSLISNKPVSKLLAEYSSNIQSLKDVASSNLKTATVADKPYSNDVFFLRYCFDDDDSGEECQQTLIDTIKWREGDGKDICQAALKAVEEATASEGSWKNDPVMSNAPHSSTISNYITDKNSLTTTSSTDDLVYCIRAGLIDDVGLMNELSVDQMADFFLYAKEVNALVANDRSLASDKLLAVLTANDLAGVKLIGGSKDFRNALSASSKQAVKLYPSLSGPSLLLNLPPLLNALVKLFTPLFPPAVAARIKFAQMPSMKSIATLRDIATGSSNGAARKTFLDDVDGILSK